jgi:hypothetical protein
MWPSLLQLLGIFVVVVLFMAVLLRPAGVLAMLLAVGIAVAAVVVTWNQVATYRAQKAAAAAQPPVTVGVTIPPPSYPRGGS